MGKVLINPKTARIIIWLVVAYTVIHNVYANINGIHQMNRESLCILYKSVPRWLFLIYEHFIELTIVVLIGVFAGVLVENYIKKIKRFFPKNQVLAFIYGSILPICSCGAIPLIEVMKQRVSLKVIITFLIAAPLLNPYIIILSLSVMGVKYSIIRIVSAFVLAILSGIIVEWITKRFCKVEIGKFENCSTECSAFSNDLFVKTLLMVKKLLPYILIGGVISFSIELFNPKQYLAMFNFSNEWITMPFMLIIGIPLYVCNGADIFILKPLLEYTDLSLGASMVFSLTSSAVCISSIVMLSKFLGKRITTIFVISIAVLSLLIGIAINLIIK